MVIEIHHLTAVMQRLAPDDVEELIEILGIHADKYRRKIGYGNGSVSMSYAFLPAKESVYLQLGVLKQLDGDDVELYHGQRLTLHGSFFDNSPEFSLERLLKFLGRFDASIKAQDIAYVDDQGVTTLEDWCRVFGEDWQSYCLGNIFKRNGAPNICVKGGKFNRIEIGVASSKSTYGTLYQRPNGTIRLELKYRDPEQIAFILEPYSQYDSTMFNERALQALVSQINVITPSSKRTRNPDKYIREPFYQAFLNSDPTKLNWSLIKEEMQRNRMQSESDQYEAGLKRIIGGLNSFIFRSLPVKSLEEIIADIAAGSQYPIWSPPLLS